MPKTILLGLCIWVVAAQSGFALFKYDLRATGPGVDASGKNVVVLAPGATVQLEIWAQVTNPAGPGNNIFGVQTILGAIVSSGVVGLNGSIDPMVFPSVFNSNSAAGAPNELSVPGDTILDLGTSSISSVTNYPKARKDPTSGGEALPGQTFLYATNNQPAGATVHPITNGFEFLMGTTTLRISDITQGGNSVASINWKIPGFTSPTLRGQLAAWTAGDNVADSGSGQQADLSVGLPILISVPEPSAFGMVLLGAMGLVGFRRLGIRQA